MHALQMRPRAPGKLSSPAATRPRVSANSFIVRAAKVADGPKIAIVGVTGAVGQEFLRVRILFCYFVDVFQEGKRRLRAHGIRHRDVPLYGIMRSYINHLLSDYRF